MSETYYVMRDSEGNAWSQRVEPGYVVFPGAGVVTLYVGTDLDAFIAECDRAGIVPVTDGV